jgi:hypothetical protein
MFSNLVKVFWVSLIKFLFFTANFDPSRERWPKADIVPGNVVLHVVVPMEDPIGKATPNSNKLTTVYYDFDKKLRDEYSMVMEVEEAIKDIEKAAPGIQFVQWDKKEDNYIHILMAEECSSHVGMIGGKQDLKLARWARKGDILHEFMHVLGFLHEHQRLDRDMIVVCSSNDTTNYGKGGTIIGSYDIDSIMHYADVPGQLETKNSPKPYKRERLSNGDKIALNRVYPPVFRAGIYEPEKDSTGLYYCGRNVIEANNAALEATGKKYCCGPDKGPKCFSCQIYDVGVRQECNWKRPLATPKEAKSIYCTKTSPERPGEEKHFGGVCEPTNGPK